METRGFTNKESVYYYASVFLPRSTKADIVTLYAYISLVNNSCETKEYSLLKKKIAAGFQGEKTDNPIVDDFVQLVKKKKIDINLIKRYHATIETKHEQSLEEIKTYLIGSAEVIGLLVCDVLDLPKKARPYAVLFARSSQYLQYIIDWKRLPRDEAKRAGLELLDEAHALKHRKLFSYFIRYQVSRYVLWERQARIGLRYVPYKYRITLKTILDSHLYIARNIRKHPLSVLQNHKQVSSRRIFLIAIRNMIKNF